MGATFSSQAVYKGCEHHTQCSKSQKSWLWQCIISWWNEAVSQSMRLFSDYASVLGSWSWRSCMPARNWQSLFVTLARLKEIAGRRQGCFTWDRAAKGMNMAQASIWKNKQYERYREIGEREKRRHLMRWNNGKYFPELLQILVSLT